ncbi:MAG: cobalamin B12-binding domain-containing protein [Armatimonadetes bacterium]|nr:cobalamin B12-binding domain-containing protein [Armatimonadota bacterium]
MSVLLVNTNVMQPPIAPVGLDYIGAALQAAGYRVDLLDLCFEADAMGAVDRALAGREYRLVGLTLRNTDDCYYPGRGWFVPSLRPLVARLRAGTDARIVLGGVGFSTMPEAVLELTGADLGVRGEGEFPLLRLAAGDREVPGLVRRTPEGFRSRPPEPGDLSALPPMPRDLADNERYHREGGQIGFETKRGCNAACVYCADPVAKGRQVRLRPPEAVADELAGLASRGIAYLHTCDAEFNRPPEHALAVCEALIARGLGERLRWYAYCSPVPFDAELAGAMRRAGCVGVNFGADSADDGMLRRLGRDHCAADVRAAVEACRRHGLVTMLDLLLGGPGETGESVRRSLAVVREIAPDRAGLSVGVRVYPGTALSRAILRGDAGGPGALRGPGAADGGFAAPTFYLSPALGEGIFPLVGEVVGGDRRFFFSDPTAADRNYNYSGNDVLVDAIARGYRGAYWDILRRLQEGAG